MTYGRNITFFSQECFLRGLALKWLSISPICLSLNPAITMCIQGVHPASLQLCNFVNDTESTAYAIMNYLAIC